MVKDVSLIKYTPGLSAVTAVLNDLEFVDGDLDTLSGQDRKWQDLVKGLETALKSNPVFPAYGTALGAAVGQRGADSVAQIQNTVVAFVAFMAEIEASQDPSERVAGIKSLNVIKDPTDPMSRIAVIAVALQNGQIIEYRRKM